MRTKYQIWCAGNVVRILGGWKDGRDFESTPAGLKTGATTAKSDAGRMAAVQKNGSAIEASIRDRAGLRRWDRLKPILLKGKGRPAARKANSPARAEREKARSVEASRGV